MSETVVPALRVAQLDVTELDDTLIQLLLNQLTNCIKYPIFTLDLTKLEPHIKTFIYSGVLYNTLWKSNQTTGQKLLGLRYGDSKTLSEPSHKILVCFLSVLIIRYWIKSTKVFGQFQSSKYLRKIVKQTRKALSLFKLVNFLVFLHQGHFHSILLRIFGLRTVFKDPNPPIRNVTFQTMSRELLWHGYAETFVFFLSIVNIHKIKRWIFQIYKPELSGENLPSYQKCCFCQEVPIHPHVGECGVHVFCHYCGATALLQDTSVKCPSCYLPVQYAKPLKTQTHLVTE